MSKEFNQHLFWQERQQLTAWIFPELFFFLSLFLFLFFNSWICLHAYTGLLTADVEVMA